MSNRWLACLVIGMLCIVSAQAKEKTTPQSLMQKSDALYYFPTAHGLTDLAVDLVIQEIQDDPVGKTTGVTYYYAGQKRQGVAVTNVPPSQARFREALIELMTPLGQYIIPQTSQQSLEGMPTKLKRVSAMIAGVKETSFIQIIGAVPEDQGGELSELRMMLDKNGLLYQIENVMKSGATVIGSVENIKTDAGWHISAIITRYVLSRTQVWKTERVEYCVVNGFTLPARYTVTYRDHLNRHIKNMDDMTVLFTNYCVNAGVGEAGITQMEATQPQPPAPAVDVAPPAAEAAPAE